MASDAIDTAMKIEGDGYAIDGFLYQLIGSIDFASSVAVLNRADSAEPQDTYTVTIEPPHGGDAVHVAGATKSTTHLKTRV